MKPASHGITIAIVLGLIGCGGGGGEDAADSKSESVESGGAFAGTAYAKVRRTVLLKDKPVGPLFTGILSLIQTCNDARLVFYGLPPVQPGVAGLEKLDTRTFDMYFDTDKAATYITWTYAHFFDYERWLKETGASSEKPLKAPDCAAHDMVERKTGTLWREGVKHELNFEKKTATSFDAGKNGFPKRTLALQKEFESFQIGLFLGEICHEVVAPVDESIKGLFAGEACIWNRFPFVSYLNWPWALSATRNYPGIGVETDTLLEIDSKHVIDARFFKIPPDFTVSP